MADFDDLHKDLIKDQVSYSNINLDNSPDRSLLILDPEMWFKVAQNRDLWGGDPDFRIFLNIDIIISTQLAVMK